MLHLRGAQVLTELFDRAPISAKQRLRVDACLTDLSDTVGACERILCTPIPVSYTRHTARFLVIWLALLPFTAYAQCGWVTIFSSVVLGFFLLAIEEIGGACALAMPCGCCGARPELPAVLADAVTIEEPFNILPLEAINSIVVADLEQHEAQMCDVIALVDVATGTQRAPLPPFTPSAGASAAPTQPAPPPGQTHPAEVAPV